MFSLFKAGLNNHQDWPKAWESPPLKDQYDVVIIGGGGHAYYLAKDHNIKNIAVLEKGYVGGGNTARNTTIIRSNYLLDESSRIFQHALDLWQDLSQDINFNVMYSKRGVYNLGHSLQDMRDIERRVNTNAVNGIKAEVVTAQELKDRVPLIDISPRTRYPIMGSSYQADGGIARHDAVAWGFARAASKLGVDIIEKCEVTNLDIATSKVKGLQTNKGYVRTPQIASVTSGHSSVIAKMAGVRLPIESHPLQAFVSEPMKPVLDTVIMSGAVHGYISQSDKGDLVIGVDAYNSYSQRGGPHIIEHTAQAIVELFPIFSRVKMNRQWGGIVDMSPDVCPIISKTEVQGLYFDCGWGTGGFKATPGSGHVFAHTIANDEPHPIAAPFSIDRFYTGKIVNEHGAAGVAQH